MIISSRFAMRFSIILYRSLKHVCVRFVRVKVTLVKYRFDPCNYSIHCGML